MSAIEITSVTQGWIEEIEAHLRAGDRAVVRFEREAMTPEQMAASVGLSRTAIMRRIKNGEIRTERVGNRHRIPLAEVERFRDSYRRSMVAAVADEL